MSELFPEYQNTVSNNPSLDNNKDNKSYKVLARKYRPTKFSELIGQDHLVTTLTNSIEKNRIAHAFLLTGIRGVGKTTTARIIAKSLSCITNFDKQNKRIINPEPCCVCSNCLSIANGSNIDVVEIDAASHTGVNDIREIIENVNYIPSISQYKIYIIDEVHMLSNSAFNALLKTLEEPPEHAKFIFATTEIRKIPITILSRCQRFDLKRIENNVLINHLEKIAKTENISIDKESLRVIANASEGSVRDSLSLFDQLISYAAQNDITYQMTENMLGIVSKNKIFELIKNLLEGEGKKALEIFDYLYINGADPIIILKDILDSLNIMAKIKVVEGYIEDSISDQDNKILSDIAKNIHLSTISYFWQIITKSGDNLAKSFDSKKSIEMTLINLSHLATLPPIEQIIGKISNITSEDDLDISRTQEQKKNFNLEKISSSEYEEEIVSEKKIEINNYEDFIKAFTDKGFFILSDHLKRDAGLINFDQEKKEIELSLNAKSSREWISEVSKISKEVTGDKWNIIISENKSAITLIDKERQNQISEIEEIKNDPIIKEIAGKFSNYEITIS